MNTNLKTLLLTTLTVIGFSCAKAPSGVRTIKQTEVRTMNQANTDLSNQYSEQTGTRYEVVSVERASKAENGVIVVSSEIKTPDGQYRPMTTTHNEGNDVRGIVNVSANTKLDVQARCVNTDCDQYILLVTTFVNNYRINQSLAISYSNQDYFNREFIHGQANNALYTDINDVVRRVGNRYQTN